MERRGINDAVIGLDFNCAAGVFLRSSGEGGPTAMNDVNKPASWALPGARVLLRISIPAGAAIFATCG
jgi:hypothetical protein